MWNSFWKQVGELKGDCLGKMCYSMEKHAGKP